jgi:hypothetical protein
VITMFLEFKHFIVENTLLNFSWQSKSQFKLAEESLLLVLML